MTSPWRGYRKVDDKFAFVCAGCNRTMSGISGHLSNPEPGDISICAYCQAVYFYQEKGGVKRIYDVDIEKLPVLEKQQIRKAQEMMREINERLKEGP